MIYRDELATHTSRPEAAFCPVNVALSTPAASARRPQPRSLNAPLRSSICIPPRVRSLSQDMGPLMHGAHLGRLPSRNHITRTVLVHFRRIDAAVHPGVEEKRRVFESERDVEWDPDLGWHRSVSNPCRIALRTTLGRLTDVPSRSIGIDTRLSQPSVRTAELGTGPVLIRSDG